MLNPQVPLPTGTESDMDNNGVVLRLNLGETSFLLIADIMQKAEVGLITHRASSNSTVLKVGHHGSDTSTCQEFLVMVSPQLAVISAEADNKFDHPSPEVIERLTDKIAPESIYRADEHGTIELITDEESLWVEVEK